MNRLAFVLPDSTRIAWTSEESKALWETRIGRVANNFLEIERASVARSIRLACIQTIHPSHMDILSQWAVMNGLSLIILGRNGNSEVYSSTPNDDLSKGYSFRVAFTPHENAYKFLNDYINGDETKIGFQLGYPECCTRFFQEVWIKQKMVDTTWPMAYDGSGKEIIEINDPIRECNILLRWLGIRAVPHLPCSFHCTGTKKFAESLIKLGLEMRFKEEIHWLQEMLEWPVEWTALHGYAEIKTPVCKILTRTDATAVKYTVKKSGTIYPEKGARARIFPFRIVDDTWTENGFGSLEIMNASHDPILRMFRTLEGVSRIADYGCGNGFLLGRLQGIKSDILCFGVDVSNGKISHAKRLVSMGEFRNGSLFDSWEIDPDTILIMPGRLLESPESNFQVPLSCRNLISYVYGDWKKENYPKRFDGFQFVKSLSNEYTTVSLFQRLPNA